MKNPFKLILFALPIVLSQQLFAQITTESASVFFSSARYDLSRDARKSLDQFMSSNPAQEGCSFRIYGYTDSDGTAEFNADLAAKRCESVRDYLSVAGIQVEVAAYGEENPFAENTTEEGKQANRRVEVYLDCRVRDMSMEERNSKAKDLDDANNTIQERLAKLRRDSLMNALADPPQVFYIDPFRDTTLVCEHGCKLIFTANSMKLNQAMRGDLVKIEVVEIFDKSEMISNNMTTKSGSAILESGGMMDVRATFEGKAVKLNSGSSFVAMVPADEYNPAMSLFDGKRQSDDMHSINWKERSVNNFSFMLTDDFFNCQYANRLSSYRCNFWCRLKGKWSKRYRKYVAIRSKGRTERVCDAFERMMKLYDADAQNEMKKALWADEFKKWNVTTIEEYYEARVKARDEMATAGLMSNNGYYVFSNLGFGTINCDFFKQGDGPLKPMYVSMPDAAAYCTLVIQKANSCLNGAPSGGGYVFEIPRNTKATVVSMYYINGNVQFATKDVFGPEDIKELVYETLTVEEVKERLKQLNDMPRNLAMR